MKREPVAMTNSSSMGELCALMMQKKLDSELFTKWVETHYGLPDIHGSAELVHWVAFHHQEPHPLDRLRVLEFDKFLTRPGVEDCEFTRSLIGLRNVFARNANMAASTTVAIDDALPLPAKRGEGQGRGAPPAAFSGQGRGEGQPLPRRLNPPASSELAEVLARLLCAEGRKAEGARAVLLEAVAPAA
jgi:hypothetical protein